ncbi:unnamed protein product [Acidithrix sp. C25]|nr:unnamed protein product [Acidithrix sp. C25]
MTTTVIFGQSAFGAIIFGTIALKWKSYCKSLVILIFMVQSIGPILSAALSMAL